MQVHGHCIIYKSQDMETTQVSTDRWMDKENVVYIYNGKLFSHKKNVVLPFATIWIDLGHWAKWNISDKDKYHKISLTCEI